MTVSAPADWVKSVSELRLPQGADLRLQELMDRNTEGNLNKTDREELEVLVELSERLSLVRSQALLVLGPAPE